MFGSLLVANRGEIARRILRTARGMGLRSIAVYSQADRAAPHVLEADEAVLIGPAPASASYLSVDAILAAAAASGAEAIHPGYGFLSENADFAEAVIAAGLVWVGPPPGAIRAMGRKDAAKRLMAEAGVPVTPGYLGADQSPERLAEEAARIGWPVLVKAVAGGGGKGMRAAQGPDTFREALDGARREALAAFGDDRVLLEALIASPRHLEVQVFADRHGNVVHLFERDCSLQRRHQKVIEEAPAPGLDAATRQSLCEAALRAARAVDYVGAGTVEFIADASDGLRPDRIWFMEMNTRLQVEHPVTEAVTGLDLVEWQLRVAAGEPLPRTQDQITLRGHAIEARLYAEDPVRGFLPSVGPLTRLRLPDAIRIDSGVKEGGEVTAFYDPMIAKLIHHAETREAAACGLRAATAKVEVWPVRANAAFLGRCLEHPDFMAGNIDTGFIERHLPSLIRPSEPVITPAIARTLAREDEVDGRATAGSPWNPDHGAVAFRMNADPATEGQVYLDGEPRAIGAPGASGDAPGLVRLGGEWVIFADGAYHGLSLLRPASSGAGVQGADGLVRTPMPGRIVAVHVSQGDTVAAGQTLAVLEAMKMEHGLVAPIAGQVAELRISLGDQVAEGIAVLKIAAPGESDA